MRVALTGLTMAEYFRDQQHQDVLLFIDNIFRYVQAGSEVSALMGRMPSAVGYQPTLAKRARFRSGSPPPGRGHHLCAGGIRPGGLTSPTPPATTFTHLDATTVLSRKIVEQGIYPAVDPLESTSRILEPDVVGERHYKVARAVQGCSSGTGSFRISSPFWAWRSSVRRTRLPWSGPAASSSSSPSPSRWPQTFTGQEGRFVKLEDTLRSFEAILGGELDRLPESAFSMTGDVDEVRKKARDMGCCEMAEGKCFHLEVVTPDRQFYIGDADSLVLPAIDGYMGVE